MLAYVWDHKQIRNNPGFIVLSAAVSSALISTSPQQLEEQPGHKQISEYS
jgi:hypothetical protein